MARKAAKRTRQRKAAVEGFEATCPTCAMTADVAADAEHVRCKGCGTVVHLVDHAVPTSSAATPQMSVPGEPAWPWPASLVALGGGFLLLAPLMAYNFAIDHREPRTGLAAMWLLVTLLGFAALVFQVRRLLRADPGAAWRGVLVSGVGLGLLGIAPAYVIAADYGKEGGAFLAGIGPGLAFFYLYLPAVLVAGVVAGLSAIWSKRAPGAIAAAVGLGVAVGIALVAVYMLVTLSEQANEAREANEAPAWGFLAMVTVLLLAAARRRLA